jgi:hypothetical protein
MSDLANMSNKNAVFVDAFTALKENSYIVNNEEVPDKDTIVQIKIDADYMGPIMGYCLDIIKGDGQISGAAATQAMIHNEYAENLLRVYHDRMEAKKVEEKRAAEYNTWLIGCFDKYVVDNDTPSCKEIAVAINNGEPGSKYGHIKYQNIMKPLREYREKKFGKK